MIAVPVLALMSASSMATTSPARAARLQHQPKDGLVAAIPQGLGGRGALGRDARLQQRA